MDVQRYGLGTTYAAWAALRAVLSYVPEEDNQRASFLAKWSPVVGASIVDADAEMRRAFAAADFAVRTILPIALISTGRIDEAAELINLPPVVDVPTAGQAHAVASRMPGADVDETSIKNRRCYHPAAMISHYAAQAAYYAQAATVAHAADQESIAYAQSTTRAVSEAGWAAGRVATSLSPAAVGLLEIFMGLVTEA